MASSSPPAPARKHVLSIFGPTAAGKTALAGELRERLGATVISADSAAVYKGVPIVTAAPDYPAELVAVVPLDRDVSVGWYQQEAHAAIDRGERPVVVGGTGLYFRAAISSLALPPAVPERRAHWQSEFDRLGPQAAHELLAERDPAAAARIHANDRKRVIRALELAEAGHSLAPVDDRLWTDDTRLPTTIVALDLPVDELDRRVDLRARAMLDAGAPDEARTAWEGPLSGTARKILGLEEFATLPPDAAVDAVAQATKRLARYQRKWLRRMPNVVTLDALQPVEKLADAVVALDRTGE